MFFNVNLFPVYMPECDEIMTGLGDRNSRVVVRKHSHIRVKTARFYHSDDTSIMINHDYYQTNANEDAIEVAAAL